MRASHAAIIQLLSDGALVPRLDINATRIDNLTQVSVNALAEWLASLRKCANHLRKDPLFIPVQVAGDNRFGSVYM